jgi:hypothetical protein
MIAIGRNRHERWLWREAVSSGFEILDLVAKRHMETFIQQMGPSKFLGNPLVRFLQGLLGRKLVLSRLRKQCKMRSGRQAFAQMRLCSHRRGRFEGRIVMMPATFPQTLSQNDALQLNADSDR